jgi:hypothetical protein
MFYVICTRYDRNKNLNANIFLDGAHCMVLRGAETWGFHESPSYPHMYCFLVWMERKNGI